MVFTRLMSPDEFGKYALTINLTATLVAILGNFLIIGLGRFEPATQTDADKQHLHSTIIISAVLMSVGVAVLTTILSVLGLSPNLSVNYFFFSILFSCSLFLMLSQKLINANLKPKAYGLSLALNNILFVVGAAACLVAGYGVHGVLASLAISTLLASLPALSLWAKTSWRSFDIEVLKQLWSYGAPLTLLYLFVMIISFSDRVFIDVFLGSKEVGLYSAGYDLTQFTIAAVASIVHLAAFPIILKAYENEGEERVRALLATSIRILLLIMLPVSLGFIAVKNEISGIFLGDTFTATSVLLIPILALSVLLSSIKSYYFDYAFQITKTTWLQLIPPILAAVFNCGLNYVLIHSMGLVGVAYATLVSYAVYLLLTVVLSKRVFKFPSFPWNFAMKVCVAGLMMMMAVAWLPTDFNLVLLLLLKIFVGVLVYCISVLVLMKNDIVVLLKSANDLKGR